MKLLPFSFALLIVASPLIASASVNGNGYYRVQNYQSKRWASMIDNQASIDLTATTADLHALSLILDYEQIITDPGSVVYIEDLGSYRYNLSAQGANLEKLVGYDVYLGPSGTYNGETLYYIYGKYNGFTKYIGDINRDPENNYGTPTIGEISSPDKRKWMFFPVDHKGSNYFGVNPDINVTGKYYTTLFTSFPYSAYSEGMKFYYIGRSNKDYAELIEIKGTVPAGTPVIVQSTSPLTTNNRLMVGGSASAVTGNTLKGSYFNYNKYGTVNQVAYNPKTMRVLGVCDDGNLGFITAKGLTSIPANTAYLTVPEGTSEQIKCITQSEYDGVHSVTADKVELRYANGVVNYGMPATISVYDITGNKVLSTYSSSVDLSGLSHGIYIVKAGSSSLKVVKN